MTSPPPEKRPEATGGATELTSLAWTEVASRAVPPTLLVPVGSCEQHGPHLPLDTDTRIAVAVAGRVAAGRADVLVAPAVAYGSSGEHEAFVGTLSIGTDALRRLLVELGRSAFPPAPAPAPFRSLVFVNGHGGNHAAVQSGVDALVAEGRPVTSWWPRVVGGDAHAGRTETSLLLALAPEVVGEERPVGASGTIGDLLPLLRRGGVRAASGNGVLGDASGASAEEGEELLAALVADLGSQIGGS